MPFAASDELQASTQLASISRLCSRNLPACLDEQRRLRRICQACLTRCTMLRSGQGGEGDTNTTTTSSSSQPATTERDAQINLAADRRGAAIIRSLSSASLQYYFLMPSLATSFFQIHSVTPLLLLLCFVQLTLEHIHNILCVCNELI